MWQSEITVKPVFKGHCDEGTPCDQGTLFQNRVLDLPQVKEPAMKGHLSCRDTFSGILRFPLKTCFTVLPLIGLFLSYVV